MKVKVQEKFLHLQRNAVPVFFNHTKIILVNKMIMSLSENL